MISALLRRAQGINQAAPGLFFSGMEKKVR